MIERTPAREWPHTNKPKAPWYSVQGRGKEVYGALALLKDCKGSDVPADLWQLGGMMQGNIMTTLVIDAWKIKIIGL